MLRLLAFLAVAAVFCGTACTNPQWLFVSGPIFAPVAWWSVTGEEQ